MINIIIVRPSFDAATAYLWSWTAKFADTYSDNYPTDVVKIFNKEEAVSTTVYPYIDSLNNGDQNVLMHFDHGRYETLFGQDKNVFLNAENVSKLAGFIVYAFACESARTLGPQAIEAGVRAYLGYKEIFGFILTKGAQFKNIAVAPAQLIAQGNSMQDVYTNTANMLTKYMNEFYTEFEQTGTYDSYMSAVWMYKDLRGLTLLGDPEAKINRGKVAKQSSVEDNVIINDDGTLTIKDISLFTLSEFSKINTYMNRQGYAWRGPEDAKRIITRYVTEGIPLEGAFAQAIIKSLGLDKSVEQKKNDSAMRGAARTFGVTNDFNSAGYILPNGSMLDFSGSDKPSWIKIRDYDHREIGRVKGLNGGTKGMQEFMSMGAIRFSTYSIDMVTPPTQAQMRTLKKYFMQNNSETNVELFHGLGALDSSGGYYRLDDGWSKTYPAKTHANKILQDIVNFYSGNLKQNNSLVQQFHGAKNLSLYKQAVNAQGYPELFELQNSTVEHRLPISDGVVSFFEEAAGDIYREMTKSFPDRGYIQQKLRRLNDFSIVNDADVQNVLNIRNRSNKYDEKLSQYINNLNILKSTTQSIDLGNRSSVMLTALSVMEELVLWLQNPIVGNSRFNSIVDKISDLSGAVSQYFNINKSAAYTQLVKDADKRYPIAGEIVDGRTVLDNIDNTSSISASFRWYEVLDDIREVPMSDFSGLGKSFYSQTEENRCKELAREIRESNEIAPLIVAVDEKGPYILEGGHRIEALYLLGAKSFPALVVVDQDDDNSEEITAKNLSLYKQAVNDRWYYSGLKKFLENKLPNSGNIEQLRNLIQNGANKGMFKGEELEYSGLLTDKNSPLSYDPAYDETGGIALKEYYDLVGIPYTEKDAQREKGIISKQDILNWVDSHQIHIDEVLHEEAPKVPEVPKIVWKPVEFMSNDLIKVVSTDGYEVIEVRDGIFDVYAPDGRSIWEDVEGKDRAMEYAKNWRYNTIRFRYWWGGYEGVL